MNELVKINPEYFDYPIQEYQGNPLVEALRPPPVDNTDALLRLRQKPLFNESERDLPASMRSLLPRRLLSFMFPTQQHVQLLHRIYRQILGGYSNRNPVTADGQRLLHSTGEGLLSPYRSSPLQTPVNISFLTGLSGMGKSTIIRAIMKSISTPVIRHSSYKGEPFPESQILYMMRNAPDQCSAKTVCKGFGDHADQLLGVNLYGKNFLDKSMTRTHYVAALRKIIVNNHVGALIIDEFQNISLAKSGGQGEFLAFILNLGEELGIPIILVGTYRAAAILKRDASIARRLVTGGFHELKRPDSHKNEEWRALCDILWQYQWVRDPKDISDEIYETLYDCSQGITGIMLNLFVTAQTQAFESGKETIDKNLLIEVYQDRFRPLHAIMDILRSGGGEGLEHYDDLYFEGMNEFREDPAQSRKEAMSNELKEKMNDQINHYKREDKPSKKDVVPRRGRKKKYLSESLHELARGENLGSDTLFG